VEGKNGRSDVHGERGTVGGSDLMLLLQVEDDEARSFGLSKSTRCGISSWLGVAVASSRDFVAVAGPPVAGLDSR
jgi:hypothetical protein